MIQIVYKVNGESFDTLSLAQMHCKSEYDNIYLYVGSKSVLQSFGYHWKREDNKEYAI